VQLLITKGLFHCLPKITLGEYVGIVQKKKKNLLCYFWPCKQRNIEPIV